jgi:transcriptional regulator with XRE-family HTH domain
MTENANIYQLAQSDNAWVNKLGLFIRQQRLAQNKTQRLLADEAGINRSTLIELEKGKGSSLITLIQLLRALDQLHVLTEFEIPLQISPIQLAEQELKKRKRASKTRSTETKPESDW